MKVIEQEAAPRVDLSARHLKFHVRPAATRQKHQQVMEQWYRTQVREELLPKWEKLLDVRVGKALGNAAAPAGAAATTARHGALQHGAVKNPCECLEYMVAH